MPEIVYQPLSALRPFPRNARTHSKKQVQQIARSIERFGFTNPVLVSDDGEIIAGHGRVRAAALLGMQTVPTIALSHLSDAERRVYVLADNKLALNAGWDSEILAIELQGLIDLDFDVTLTGFSLAEIDLTIDAANDAKPTGRSSADDCVPQLPEYPVTRRGELWQLGRHLLLCGDARDPDAYVRLLGNARADLVFTDPPYNVAIDGNVTGLGKVKHAEFAMASGEMSEDEFTAFLKQSLGAMAEVCRDGAIAFVCMDWRHMGELLSAGRAVFSELKNLVVWNKTNGGMGAFYRSKHELSHYCELRDKKAEGEQLLARARSKGLPEPELLPHPDDIKLDHDQLTAWVAGPVTPEELTMQKFLRQLRDFTVLRSVYQQRFPSLIFPVDPKGHAWLQPVAEMLNDRLCSRMRWGRYGFWEATQPLRRRGFRFMEADMHEHIWSLAQVWENEPALAPMRKAKVVNQLMNSLLDFKTRSRERRIWQRQHEVLLAVFREAYGPEKVAHIPRRASLRSYAERQAALEALPEDQRGLLERRASVIAEAGCRLPCV